MKLFSRKNLKLGRDYNRDWTTIFFATFILTVLLIATGFLFCRKVRYALSTPSPVKPSAQALPIDVGELNKVMLDFKEREVLRSSIIRDYTLPRDPSL